MAWNDDRNGIAPIRQSDSADGFGIADALRELQVGNSLPIRNAAQCVPNAKLELRSLQRQWQIEFLQLAAEIGLQLPNNFSKWSLVLYPVRLRWRCMLAALKAHQPQPVRVAPKQQRPDATLKRCVKHRVHFLRSSFDASAPAAATAYGLAARYRFSNSSRVHIVLMSTMRSTARMPSRWSISCCKSSERFRSSLA